MTLAIIQKAAIGNLSGAPDTLVATFPAPLTPGNEILLIKTMNLPGIRTWPSGFVEISLYDEDLVPVPGPASIYERIHGASKTVGASESDTFTVTETGGDRSTLIMFEAPPGEFTAGLFKVDESILPDTTTTEPEQLLIAVTAYLNGLFPATPPSGWTIEYGELGDAATWVYGLSGGNSMETPVWSRIVAPGTYGGTFPIGGPGSLVPVVVFAFEPVAPTPGVVVDFEDDGFNVGSDDTITLDVMDWTITRGASAEITGGANPGSAVFHTRRLNRDGKYNPRNVSGPLYGFLRDGLRVHIAVNDDGTLSDGGTVKGLFAGRVTDITVLPDAGADDAVVTEFACEDPLAWYQRTPCHVSDSRTRSHRELRLAVLAAIGETRYSLDSEIGTMPLSSADGDAFAVLGRINAANGTRHFAKPSDLASDWYRYTTYNRQHKLAGVSDASIDAGSEHVTDTSGWRLSADTVTNQQRAVASDVSFLPAARAVWAHDSLPLIVSGTVVIWATLPDYVDGATVEYDNTGTAPTVTITPFGRTAKITLVSAGTTTFTALLVRGYEAVHGDEQAIVIDDLTSQLPPRGVRAGSDISGDYVGVTAMARGIASHIVWRYASPQMRPTLTLVNWFPEMFEVDLFDVIDLTSLNLGSDAVLFEIVGLTHTGYIAADAVQHHSVTYVLQESRVQAPYPWFVLDTSELDSADHLAY